VCAGATLGWLLKEMHRWSSRPRLAWQALLVILVAAAALFPLLGGMFKIKDRMVSTAPHTLDGMTYMAYATYDWLNTSMDLNQDYQAIRWMQENIQGSPVIVEANSRDLYRWYSRFTIYTGLPGVVGWDWHQQQQRGFASGDWISKRVQEINDFYNTSDLELARAFLQRYNVRYIIVGQLEWATYSDVGLQKFPGYDGLLWQEIYKDRDTVIYEVINQ
jgi:uncharacterized membrane protein